MTAVIRALDAGDEASWQKLWDGYSRFYEREPNADVTHHLWLRLFDPSVPVHAIVAEHGGMVIGLAHYLVHENTSALTPVCYLQDLFVDPACRGQGVGRQLIDWLVAETVRQQWSRLYWHTRENNYRARLLYDSYTPHRGSVCYVLENPAR